MTNKIHEILKSSAWSKRSPWAGPLFWCAYKGWTEACKVLLPLDEDPNALWEMELDRGMTHLTSETCLFAAVASRVVATVQVFLDDVRIKPNLGKDSYYQGHVTPLMQVCEQGDGDIVKMLLARDDVDVNECDDGGYAAGLPAILRANSDIIALLLQRDDLDVNILQLGRRPVHHLAKIGGSPNELEILLRNSKTDVNGRTEEEIYGGGKYVYGGDRACFCHNRTALMVAAFVGNPAQTSVLLNHPRIELGLRDSQGMTDLMLASVGWLAGTVHDAENSKLQNSIEQHGETVRTLLASMDSAMNEQDVRGRTALIFASMGGVDPRWDGSRSFDAVFEKLDLELWYKSLARKFSLSKDHHVEIVEALLRDDKVNVNLPDCMGHTALDYATWTRDFMLQKRDWEMQSLIESIREDNPYPNGSYWVPDVDAQDVMARARAGFAAMSQVHDVLVASGAHSRDPIGPLAIPQDREPAKNNYSGNVVEAAKRQEMLESFVSALDKALKSSETIGRSSE